MATDTLTADAPTTAPRAAGSRSSRLDPLRVRLDAVRKRRLFSRRLTAWTAVVAAVLGALLVAFAFDWLFGLPRAGRLWLWAGIIAAVVWAFRRYARPLLRVQENDIDVALSMEKAHGIDSDFVAALQFERPEADGWGSETLRTAVVDYVSEFGRQWTSAAPLWNRLLAGRAAWAAGLLAAFALVGVASPGTLRAFAERMALGSRHYPTWTRIEGLVISGREIDPTRGGEIRAPAGQPLAVEVTWAGRQPGESLATFVGDSGGGSADIPLVPPETEAAEGGRPALAGELPNLTESATVVVHVGDARSESVRIVAVPAPVVEANLVVEPPAYARDAVKPASAGRQTAVLEGSSVALEVVCLNKDLTSAEVLIDGAAHPLVRQDGPDGRPRFVLSGSGSPLAAVTEPVQYEVRAVDSDGLSPDRPPSGTIRIRPDGPPQIVIDAITRAVVPTARPTISYTVKDDYGVARLRANVVVQRADAEPAAAAAPAEGEAAEPPGPPATGAVEIRREGDPPLVDAALPHRGKVAVPLGGYGLKKGDFVRVTLEAVDFRGPTPGQAATSAPIDFSVTDENGVLEALQRADTQAAEELKTIIEDQLRVGEKP